MKQYDIYMMILGKTFRGRPGMFIGELSPNNLRVYLDGYRAAMRDAGVIDASAPEFHEFHYWVANKFGFSRYNVGWNQVVLAVTLGANPEDIRWENYDRHATAQQLKDATYRCFELIEEFHNSESSRKQNGHN